MSVQTPPACCRVESRGIAVAPATKYRLSMFLRGNRTAASGGQEETDLERGPAFLDVPVIPANDLRGRLRRLAARAVFDVRLKVFYRPGH